MDTFLFYFPFFLAHKEVFFILSSLKIYPGNHSRANHSDTIFLFKKYIFLWLFQVLAEALVTFSCGMWDLVPQPRIEPEPPALGAQSLSPWTTTEVPIISKLYIRWQYFIPLSIYWMTVPATELDRKERAMSKIPHLTLMTSRSNRKGNHTYKQQQQSSQSSGNWEEGVNNKLFKRTNTRAWIMRTRWTNSTFKGRVEQGQGRLWKLEFNGLKHNRVWEQYVSGETGVPIMMLKRWHGSKWYS